MASCPFLTSGYLPYCFNKPVCLPPHQAACGRSKSGTADSLMHSVTGVREHPEVLRKDFWRSSSVSCTPERACFLFLSQIHDFVAPVLLLCQATAHPPVLQLSMLISICNLFIYCIMLATKSTVRSRNCFLACDIQTTIKQQKCTNRKFVMNTCIYRRTAKIESYSSQPLVVKRCLPVS